MKVYAAPEWDCLDDDGKAWVCALVKETARRVNDFAKPPSVAGRVEVAMDHPLAKALRPSADTLAEIERIEHASALGYEDVRNMPLGSDSAHPPAISARGGEREKVPQTAAELTAIIEGWLYADDATHWGEFEKGLHAVLTAESPSPLTPKDYADLHAQTVKTTNSTLFEYERQILWAEVGTQRILNEFRKRLEWAKQFAEFVPDALDPKAAEILGNIIGWVDEIDVTAKEQSDALNEQQGEAGR